MASAQSVRAGKAFVELGVDDKITAGLNRAAAKFKAFGATLAGSGARIAAIGSGITAPFIAAAKVFDSMGSALFDASQRTGVAVEDLSALKLAAEQSGASFEDLETAIRFMQKQGIGFERFGQVADELASIEDPAKRTARAVELFGKNGTAILPMLADGAAGLAAMRKQAEDLGLVMSSEDAAAADEFGDALTAVFAQLKAITFQAGAAVAKALLPFAGAIGKVLRGVIDFVKRNQGLVVAVTAVGATLTVVGVAIVGLGAVITSLGVIVGALAAAFTFLISPVGLTLLGIAALTAAVLKFTPAGTFMLQILKDIGRIADETFQGIADALANGNIELAAKILMASLKQIFAQGLADLQLMFGDISQDALLNLIKARDELAKLRAQAASGRPGTGSRRTPSLGEIDDSIAAVKSNITATGIFNGAAFRSLVGGGNSRTQEDIRKNTKDTVDALKRLNIGLVD